MILLRSKRSVIIASAVVSLLMVSGCTPPAVDSTSDGTTSSGIDPTSESEAAQTAPPEVFGPGSFDLQSPLVGLTDLSGYRATLTMTFEGTEAGQTVESSRTYVMLTNQTPAASKVSIDVTGASPQTLFAAQTNGALYERRGSEVCTSSAAEGEGMLSERYEPAGFLYSVIGADAAGSETLNGIAANYYTFDERAIGVAGIAESTGQFWVASEGGYVLRYTLTTEAGAEYFGEGVEGTSTWDYELTDINQPITITLPNDCPVGMIDAPVLPDATDVIRFPGTISYDTVTSVADAAAFYQNELPALGWESPASANVGEAQVMLDFTQGDQTLSLIIFADGGVTTVHLSIVATSMLTPPMPAP